MESIYLSKEWSLLAEASIARREKKGRLNFGRRCYFNTMITKEASSYSEMYVCWDSEHDSFAENSVVDFMVGCINDDRKLCKNRNTQVSKCLKCIILWF